MEIILIGPCEYGNLIALKFSLIPRISSEFIYF
jgi:hypothetical protein